MAVDRIRRLVAREQDLFLAGALALGALIEVWTADALTTAEQLASTPLVLVATLSLIRRRRTPLAVLAVLAVSFFVGSLVVPLSGEDPTAPAIAVAVALYSVGAHASGIRA